MKSLKNPLLVSSALLLALSSSAFGEANMSFSGPSGTPAAVNANVDFTINVPKILILRIGDWGATTNNPTWNYAFGGHASLSGATPSYTGGNASQSDWDALTNTDPDAETATTDGTLQVAVFSNFGSVDLSISAVSAFTGGTSGYNQPLLSEISATNAGGTTPISHADLDDFTVGNTKNLPATAGIVKATDAWTYKYDPSVTPAAGTYGASVTYTLASA